MNADLFCESPAAGAAPADAGAPDSTECPVCRVGYDDTHEAANCCLWKGLDPLARFHIAYAVERGAEWADAIASHAARLS